MAGFGGAVKLTGESEYRKALNLINISLREMSSEMRLVTEENARGEKSNKELRQEKERLTEVLRKQKEALNEVKAQIFDYSAKVEDNKRKHVLLVDSLVVEERKLDEIRKRSGESSEEYVNQANKCADLRVEIDKSNQTISAQESNLAKMNTQFNNASAEILKTEGAIDKLGKEEEENVDVIGKLNDGYSVFKGVLANLSTQAINGVVSGLKKLVGVGKDSLNAYSQYEQLVGGIETLYKDASGEALEYAKQGWKTAGVSANSYMEQITGFSATLLQGLEGDTKKAVEYGNLAIIDMSDNANKMGTNIGMIQHAYQGFAKNNYTMLDNLKLGYGGTASEMARLINDSGVLGKSVEVTAKNVKDVPFDKVIEAIHQIQSDLGITGTTVEESTKTIEGSQKKLSASWDNLKVGIADDTADIESLVGDMTESVVDYIKNVAPRVKQIVKGLGETGKGLIKEIGNILDDEALNSITELIGDVIDTISDSAPQLMDMGTKLIGSLLDSVGKNSSKIAQSGVQMITTLVRSASDILPKLMGDLASELIKELPNIVDSLVKGVGEMTSAILRSIQENVFGIENSYYGAVDRMQNRINDITTYVDMLNNTKGDVTDYNNLLSNQGRKISEIESDYKETEDKITQILSTAIKEQRGLREDEIKAIEEYNEKIAELNGEKLEIYLRQQKAQVLSLQAQLDNLSEEELYKFLANQESAMNESKAIIEQDYQQKLVDLQNYYSAQGMLESEEYQRALEQAKIEMENKKAVSETYYDQMLQLISTKMAENVAIETDGWDTLKEKNKEYTDVELTNAQKVAGGWASQSYDNIKMKEAYVENMTKMMETNGDTTKSFFNMVEKTKEAGGDLNDTTKDAVNSVLDNFDGLPQYLEEDGKQLLLGLVGGMEDKIPAVKDASNYTSQEIVDAVRDYLGIHSPSRVMEEIGEYTVEGLTNGMKNKESHIKNEMKSIATIISIEANKIQSDAYKSGQSIADGVWKGLKAQESTLQRNVKTMMNGIVQSVNNALGIHSPSRVFAQIGEYMAEGLGVGFGNAMGDVSRDIVGQIPSSVGDLGVSNGSVSGGKYEMNVYVQELSSAQREALFNEFDRFAGGRI